MRQEDVPGGPPGLDDVLAGGRKESFTGRTRQLRSCVSAHPHKERKNENGGGVGGVLCVTGESRPAEVEMGRLFGCSRNSDAAFFIHGTAVGRNTAIHTCVATKLLVQLLLEAFIKKNFWCTLFARGEGSFVHGTLAE